MCLEPAHLGDNPRSVSTVYAAHQSAHAWLSVVVRLYHAVYQ